MENENVGEIKILNPWLSIWFKPRETISRITAAKPLKIILLLGILTGIELCFSFFSRKENIGQFSLTQTLLIILLAGPVAGVACIFITSTLIKITGGWLGGNGSIMNIGAAVACGNIPIICSLPFSILTMLLSFKIAAANNAVFIQALVVDMYIVLAIWSFFILLNCLMQVQGFFSLWGSFFNLLLTQLLIFLLFIMGVYIINLLNILM